VTALGTLIFGAFADGLASAIPIWFITGVGFAGAYMPGLKALTDRLPPGENSRAVTLYTSSFSLGVGLSFLVAQVTADWLGWRAAFFVTGVGPLAMIATCLAMSPHKPAPSGSHLLDFRPAFRNRDALGYILGYGAHCFELYGIRTWIVGFWAFVVARNKMDSELLSPVVVSVIFTLLAMPASILGNEAALRFGRHRALTVVMLSSAVVALIIGVSAASSPFLLLPVVLVYAVTVTADSGALTAGMSAAATPGFRGVTLALHSTIGFGLSAAGSWGTGIALDAAGGAGTPSGWLAAFCVLAVGVALGPLALMWARHKS
jgi:predicted MFS family arabinose efflux permease